MPDSPIQIPESATIYKLHNGLNPAPYDIEVVRDQSLDQYRITISILGKKFSRMEKTRSRAVEYAKRINTNLESAFLYTWEDQDDEPSST